MLDLRRLRVLREVITRGSFSAAADSLHLSQSAVSQQVAALEREVGMPLLERTSDGPRLTEAGATLTGHADAAIARLDEAERELAELAGLEGGRLRLVSFPTASATLVTQAMSTFRQRYPNVELQFGEAECGESIPALKRGECDIAMAFDYPTQPDEVGRDLERHLVLEEEMRVALPGGHPLAAADTVDIADLAEEDWLCGVGADSCRANVFGVCRAAGFEPRVSFESDDYEVLKGLIAAGLGVTLLPELAGSHPQIELRGVRPEPPTRRVWAVGRDPAIRSPAANAMIEILVEVGERFGERFGERPAEQTAA